MVADEVPRGDEPPGHVGIRLHPAALDEERRRDPAVAEDVDDPVRHPRRSRAVGMLRVEGERDPEGGYFSTPVMTMPRTKNRWKTRNRRTGITRVMSVAA